MPTRVPLTPQQQVVRNARVAARRRKIVGQTAQQRRRNAVCRNVGASEDNANLMLHTKYMLIIMACLRICRLLFFLLSTPYVRVHVGSRGDVYTVRLLTPMSSRKRSRRTCMDCPGGSLPAVRMENALLSVHAQAADGRDRRSNLGLTMRLRPDAPDAPGAMTHVVASGCAVVDKGDACFPMLSTSTVLETMGDVGDLMKRWVSQNAYSYVNRFLSCPHVAVVGEAAAGGPAAVEHVMDVDISDRTYEDIEALCLRQGGMRVELRVAHRLRGAQFDVRTTRAHLSSCLGLRLNGHELRGLQRLEGGRYDVTQQLRRGCNVVSFRVETGREGADAGAAVDAYMFGLMMCHTVSLDTYVAMVQSDYATVERSVDDCTRWTLNALRRQAESSGMCASPVSAMHLASCVLHIPLLRDRRAACDMVMDQVTRPLRSTYVSVHDPSGVRISVPARGRACEHIQVFDLTAAVRSAGGTILARGISCPLCARDYRMEDVYVDAMMARVLHKYSAISRCEFVTVEATTHFDRVWVRCV